MKTVIASLVSVAVLISIPAPADAASKRKKNRNHDHYSQSYPSATPRQLHNLRAYERGEYYEQLSDALPVGSKAWFEQREREGNRFPW